MNEINEMNIIFSYELKNSIGLIIKGIYVTKDGENNLHLVDEDRSEKVSTIKIDKLEEVLKKHEKAYYIVRREKLPLVPVLDGYLNEVYFQVEDMPYRDKVLNLAYYGEEQIKNCKHLEVLLQILDDVYDVLYEENKDIENYFKLNVDNEEEDEEDTE